MKPAAPFFPCLAIGLALLAPAPARAAEPVTIKLATILPVGTSGHQSLMDMRDSWQKTSGQSVKLNIYAGSADGEALLVKKMRARQIHAALLSAVGLSEIDKSLSSLQLMPMVFRNWGEVDYVREAIRPILEARLREKGFVVLFWADAGWVRFFSKETGVYPDDFKKMKMFSWAGEPQQMEIMRGLGYQPVSLETEQIIPALTTGMVSVVPVPPFIANALQYNRQAGHMLDLNWVPIVGAAIVRRDIWETIPPETRAALLATAGGIGEKIRAHSRAEDEDAVVAMTKRGLIVQPVSPPVEAAWLALAAKTHLQIRGPIVPADIFDEVQARLAEYRTAHPAAGR